MLALTFCLCMIPSNAFAAVKSIQKEKAVITDQKALLTFSSDQPFSLKTENRTKNWDGKLEYSNGEGNWQLWDGRSELHSRNYGGKEVLFLRGTRNTYISRGLNHAWVLNGSNIECKGNIETLLDYQTVSAGGHPQMGVRCFFGLFAYNQALVTAPDLPAENLADYCYACMFGDCKQLRSAPVLSATVMKDYCYLLMFAGCSSLKGVQEILPAMQLAEGCYMGMFAMCGLTAAPKLPAIRLADRCYERMFYRNRNLKATPALPATKLAFACYFSMFQECTNLVYLPALPATYLPKSCYGHMFYGCEKIMLSLEPNEEYNVPYRIPIAGNVEYVGQAATREMFLSTGGSYTGTFQSDVPVNRTYYLNNSNGIIY